MALALDPQGFELPLGMPMLRHGLKNSNHLNGKIGDARTWNEKAQCYGVYFEDKKGKPCLVKQENIHILFELPDE